MYTGTNPSALRSKEWLCGALLELLEEKPYAKITVKEICEKADLSRQTFYQMFDSKNEVIEYFFLTLFEDFSKECSNFQHISMTELTCQFFQFFYEQRKFIQIMLENHLAHIIEEQFEVYLSQMEFFQILNAREPLPDYSLAYTAGALTMLLTHWFRTGFSVPVEKVALQTEWLLVGDAFDMETLEYDSPRLAERHDVQDPPVGI